MSAFKGLKKARSILYIFVKLYSLSQMFPVTLNTEKSLVLLLVRLVSLMGTEKPNESSESEEGNRKCDLV